jgi:hypothetical protein
MVNFSYALLQPFRQQNPEYSILDLKSHYRGYRYASETMNYSQRACFPSSEKAQFVTERGIKLFLV